MKKTEKGYTQAQFDAAVVAYRAALDKLQSLRDDAEELLSEGEMASRRLTLRKIDAQMELLSGMRTMAAAVGIAEADLKAAAEKGR